MIETNLQEAIAQLSLDEDYRNQVTQNPDQFLKDYGINTQETLPVKSGDATMINEAMRPTALCCCTCAPA